MRYLVLAAGFLVSACGMEEQGIPGVWQVETLDGEAFAARARLDLSDPERISGQAPCNGFSAPRTGDLPALALGPVVATRMACPALAEESLFFRRLEAMTRAEVSGDRLILSDGAGGAMVLAPVEG